jgi:ATP-dependent RNA helicase DDX49/DBP8
MEFNNLGVDNWLLKVCGKIGYKHPTEIQRLSFKPILEGESIIANAETGSGKTAAFAFPLLQRLAKDPYGIFAIVIAPCRELAIQIH